MALHDHNGKNSMFIKMIQSVKNLMTKDVREEAAAKFIHNKRLDKDLPIIAQLHELILKQEIELRKLDKPPIGYDADGKEVEIPRTKEQHEARNKAKERLDKMHKAYDKWVEGDTSDAFNIIQQSGSKDKGTKEGSGESS